MSLVRFLVNHYAQISDVVINGNGLHRVHYTCTLYAYTVYRSVCSNRTKAVFIILDCNDCEMMQKNLCIRRAVEVLIGNTISLWSKPCDYLDPPGINLLLNPTKAGYCLLRWLGFPPTWGRQNWSHSTDSNNANERRGLVNRNRKRRKISHGVSQYTRDTLDL